MKVQQLKMYSKLPKHVRIKNEYGISTGGGAASSNLFSNIGVGIKKLFGGNIDTYQRRRDHARELAVQSLSLSATKLGANALFQPKFEYEDSVDPLIWSSRYSYCFAYATAIEVEENLNENNNINA